jgi:hypothetical protein
MLTSVPPSSGLRNVAPETNKQTYLSFELLEDVMNLPPSKYEEIVERAVIMRIGPLVEYAYHHYKGTRELLSPFDDNQVVNSLTNILHVASPSRASIDTSIKPRPIEFFKCPQSVEEVEDPNWIAFCLRLMYAGMQAGLSKEFSQALAGTFEEMTGNLLEHSEEPHSGIVGYRYIAGEFEYVVADAGIGVLKSLRSHPDYSWLSDSGEALETAVSSGESRHGRRQLRGFGFDRLMYNIAQRNSYLRFRSGDHSYSIDGTRPTPLKKTQHCAHFQGFLISIISRPSNKEVIRRA